MHADFDFMRSVAMCDLTVEVLVDDAVEFIFSQWAAKDEEWRVAAKDEEDYAMRFGGQV
jgi:hypothetical protein